MVRIPSLSWILARMGAVHFLMASIVAVSLVGFVSKRFKQRFLLRPFFVKRDKQWYRLFTAGWLHADAGHLLTNLFVLWMFHARVVKRFGDLLFIAMFVSAVFVGYLLTTVRFRNKPRYGSLGASGAVAAVMFSAIVLDPGMRVGLLFLPIRVPGLIFGLLYLAYSVWHSWGSDDGINHDAHFTGALYGVLVTALWAPKQALYTFTHLQRLLM